MSPLTAQDLDQTFFLILKIEKKFHRTVASALNSLAAVTSEDIVSIGLNIKINPDKGAIYAKWMSLGYVEFNFTITH